MIFNFGKNWLNFSGTINNESIMLAMNSLQEFLNLNDFKNKTFIDVGCGSGIFSLSAVKMNAKVRAFDYDTDSVICTQNLISKYSKKKIIVEQGSILDKNFIKKLGKYDYVYSWGVLHHTGNMKLAIENIDQLVKKNGRLFISIYNDQGLKTKFWKIIKLTYNRFLLARPFIIFIFMMFLKLPEFIYKKILKKDNSRGMNHYYDLIDWLGGYPFETAKKEDIITFYENKSYKLLNLNSVSKKSGCNEFLFLKK